VLEPERLQLRPTIRSWEGRVVAVDPSELRTVLERSRMRVVHVFVGAAAIHVAVASAVIATASSGLTSEIEWCVVAGAVVASAGWLWHRARVRAIEQLISAIARGSSLYRCVVTHLWGYRVIPLGYQVEMVAVDAAKARTPLVFGFWRRQDAEQLVALLRAHLVAGPLPPIELTLWRPAGRGDGAKLPTATARVRSDDARS
jgi:hypothetical protein